MAFDAQTFGNILLDQTFVRLQPAQHNLFLERANDSGQSVRGSQ